MIIPDYGYHTTSVDFSYKMSEYSLRSVYSLSGPASIGFTREVDINQQRAIAGTTETGYRWPSNYTVSGQGSTLYDTKSETFYESSYVDTTVESANPEPLLIPLHHSETHRSKNEAILEYGESFSEFEDYYFEYTKFDANLLCISFTNVPPDDDGIGTSTRTVGYFKTVSAKAFQNFYNDPVGVLRLKSFDANAEPTDWFTSSKNKFSTNSSTHIVCSNFTLLDGEGYALAVVAYRPVSYDTLSVFQSTQYTIGYVATTSAERVTNEETVTETLHITETNEWSADGWNLVNFNAGSPFEVDYEYEISVMTLTTMLRFCLTETVESNLIKNKLTEFTQDFYTIIPLGINSTVYKNGFIRTNNATNSTDTGFVDVQGSTRARDTVLCPEVVMEAAGAVNCFESVCREGFFQFNDTTFNSPIFLNSTSFTLSHSEYEDTFDLDFPGHYIIKNVKKFPNGIGIFSKIGYGKTPVISTIVSSSTKEISGAFFFQRTGSGNDEVTILDGVTSSASYGSTVGYVTADYTDFFATDRQDNSAYQIFSVTRSFDKFNTFKMVAGVSLLNPIQGNIRFSIEELNHPKTTLTSWLGRRASTYTNYKSSLNTTYLGGNNGFSEMFGISSPRTVEIFNGNWHATNYNGDTPSEGETETSYIFTFGDEGCPLRTSLELEDNTFLFLSHKFLVRQAIKDRLFNFYSLALYENMIFSMKTALRDVGFGLSMQNTSYNQHYSCNYYPHNHHIMASARWTTEELGDR